MIHHHIEKSPDVSGFAVSSARDGEKIDVGIRRFITSNESEFYQNIQSIYNLFLQRFINLTQCNNFLILRHKDKSADIYINDFSVVGQMRSKKDVEAGDLVKEDDVADIISLNFPEIKIVDTDAVICCLRVGWKFVLYYNFMANMGDPEKDVKLNMGALYSDLAYGYRFLLFEERYNMLNQDPMSQKMLIDGWFPFIELTKKDYKELSDLYNNNWLDHIDDFIKKFDKDRIDRIVKNWWTKKGFKDNQKIIEAGISAFSQGDDFGYINCINTLYPQIEGIMGYEYFKEKGKNPSFKELKDYIKDKAKNRFSKNSLGFPDYFYDYMDKILFKNFCLETGEVDLSRHSTMHGHAKPEDFTNVKALQAILILNQIYFYL